MQSNLCDNFEGFLSKGSTQPFLSMDNNDDLYVVKAHGNLLHKNPLCTKALFNEYITGVLAKEIGLNWPKVQIVELSQRVTDELERNNYKVLSKWAVGIEFMKGLQQIYWPPNIEFKNPKFYEINAQHILESFPDEKCHDAFYGKSVIDNWLLIEDTTYDTLHKGIDGRPVFLDAHIALGGLDWDESKLSFGYIYFETCPYMCGFNFNTAKFVSWIDRVEKIPLSTYSEILEGIPNEWDVPSEFIKCTKDYLYCTNKEFIPNFKEQIEIKTFSKKL